MMWYSSLINAFRILSQNYFPIHYCPIVQKKDIYIYIYFFFIFIKSIILIYFALDIILKEKSF